MMNQVNSLVNLCQWLIAHGWHSRNDAQWSRIAPLWDELATLRAENARLDQAIADTAAQLTDAVHRVAELEAELREAWVIITEVERETASDDYGDLYAAIDDELLTRMQQQADAFHAENGRLRQQQSRITVIARPYNGGLDCEGDGSGPGCENRAAWEIQAMHDDGSNYVYVCNDHLSDYQRWANGDGRLPMVFEAD